MRLANHPTLRTCAAIALVIMTVGWIGSAPAPATGLADHRAYEMVSPALKNGGDVIGDSSRVQAATSESSALPMAATFATLVGFGDAIGTGVATEYLSERDGRPGTRGWSVHAITPAQDALSFGGAAGSFEPAFLGDLAGDLSRGVLQAWSPLTPDPDVAQVENLYLRSNLRSPGAGAYALLTACVVCATTGPLAPLPDTTKLPVFASASADFAHVIFESQQNLTADATGSSTKLYEAANGTLRLFTGPGNAGCPGGAPCSAAGVGARNHRAAHTISVDGSRAIFTSPIGGNDDQPRQGTGADAAKIYEFDDHRTADPGDDTTVQVNASERTDCAGDPTCGGDGIANPAPDTPQFAHYEDASLDGSRVFLTTSEQLTDDAPPDGQPHLYMWTAAPDARGHHLTLIDVDSNASDHTGPVDGVIGASADGHFVYFIADGALLNESSSPRFATSIYLWHDEGGTRQLEFVGYLNNQPDATSNINPLQTLPKVGRVTPDGKHLLFEASDGTGLTGYSHGACPVVQGQVNSNGGGTGCSEAYVYSADTHALLCASCNPTGAPATANVFVINAFGLRKSAGSTLSTQHLSHAISDDGRRVFFSTAEALVPEDINGKVDVYEYDVPERSLHLISSGKDTADSWFMDASPNGNDVFFVTRERLVGWDVDESYDLYDARIGGGFPDPPPVSVGCSGEGCQGQVTDSPGTVAPGSVSLLSKGNVKAAPKAKRKPCKRGFERRRVKGKLRCAKRPVHKARRASRVNGHRNGR